MSNYRPSEPFNVPMYLETPEVVKIKGSNKKTYVEKGVIYCSFKSFGGTEATSN